MKKIIILLTLLYFLPTQGYAWSGYNYDNGSHVDIEKGSLVREGNDIEIYDYNSGGYKTVEVESVSSGEVEYTDPDSGETVTIDMD